MAEAVTCAGAMMISFSTVRLARITSAIVDVWAIVVFVPTARVNDCEGATEALIRISVEVSAGSMPRSTCTSDAARAPVTPASGATSSASARTRAEVNGAGYFMMQLPDSGELSPGVQVCVHNCYGQREFLHALCGNATVGPLLREKERVMTLPPQSSARRRFVAAGLGAAAVTG